MLSFLLFLLAFLFSSSFSQFTQPKLPSSGTFQIVHAATSKCLRFSGASISDLILDDCDKAVDYSLSLFQVYSTLPGKYANTDATGQNLNLILKPELQTDYYFVKDKGLVQSKASIYQAIVIASPPVTASPLSFTLPMSLCYRAQVDVTDQSSVPSAQIASSPAEAVAGANCLKVTGSALSLVALVNNDASFVWYFRPKNTFDPNNIRIDVKTSSDNDDIVNFIWRAKTAEIAGNPNLFFSVQGATGTKVSGVCNSRYPFFSSIVFNKIQEVDSDANYPYLIANASVPVGKLLACGVTTSTLVSADDTIKYNGRVGFYLLPSNDGFFFEFSVESPPNLVADPNYIDNPDTFNWFFQESIEVTPSIPAFIRFYTNGNEQNSEIITLQKAVMNVSLINAEQNYTFKSMTLFLYNQNDKSDYEYGPAVVYPYWTAITSTGPIKYNTQEYLVDLKYVPSGKYKFVVKYELSLVTSRLLQSEEEEENDFPEEKFNNEIKFPDRKLEIDNLISNWAERICGWIVLVGMIFGLFN